LSTGIIYASAIIIDRACRGGDSEARDEKGGFPSSLGFATKSREHDEFWYHLLSVALILPCVIGSSLILMETPLALFALLVGAYLVAIGHNEGLCFLTVASFTRPELGLFLCFYLIERILKRKFDFQSLLWVLGPVFLFCAYNAYFFHAITLHTAQAKRLVYDISFRQAAWWVLNGFYAGAAGAVYSREVRLLLALGVVATLSVLLFKNFRNVGDIVYWWVLPSLGIGLFYTGFRVFVQSWYVPLYAVPFVISAIIVGLRTRSRLLIALLLAAGIPSVVGLGQTIYASMGHYEVYPGFAAGARVKQYLAVGKDLFEKYPSSRLLTSEIGGLGYSFQGKILDGVGLVSPDALSFHPMNIPGERSHGAVGAIPVGYVERARPELIVSLDLFVRKLLDSKVIGNYERIRYSIYTESDMARTKLKSLWGSDNLNVFIRKDVVHPE